MKIIKEVKISYWAHHFTTIVSVTLVLLLLGIMALVWIGASRETRRLQENVELSVVMADSIPEGRVEALAAAIESEPYSSEVRIISKEEALSNWTRDTGEDLQEVFGLNPLSDEISFTLNPEYSDAASISSIEENLQQETDVEGVATPDAAMVDAMNSNIRTLSMLLAAMAAVMLLISFVLINNTVHLSIYSRRFTIHTMQLVGATDGFIRRPVIVDNVLAGVISGGVATALLAAAMCGVGESLHVNVAAYVGWGAFGIVGCGLVALGAIICALAAWLACTRYLDKDYDELFK